MVFRANGLRDAIEGQGEAAFTDWSYASYDPLETILAPNYFAGVDRRCRRRSWRSEGRCG